MKNNIVFKVVLFLISILLVIACIVFIIILAFKEWKMLLAIAGLITTIIASLILFIEITMHVFGTIKTNYWDADFVDTHEGNFYTTYHD